jgi:hypothetical protein
MAEVDILQDAAVLIEHPRFGRGCLFGLKKGEDLAKAHYRAYLVTEKRFVRINKKDVPYWTSLRVLRDDGRCDTIPRADVLRMINEDEPADSSDNDTGAVAAPAGPAQAPVPAPVPAPVYDRPPVSRGAFRYARGDVLRFVDPGWEHNPKFSGPSRTREGIITEAYVYDGNLAYAIRFTLLNGRRKTLRYTAKPYPVKHPAHDPNKAIDTSPNVIYLHS